MRYDVAVIGGGVIGGMIARCLMRYSVKACILEKGNDVATGASGANTAIIHAGFDATPGTLKAEMNVRGNDMMENVCRELGVKFKRNGSLVVGFSDSDRQILNELLLRGQTNGVPGLSILERDEILKKEPNIGEGIICALYAPTAGIVCPYGLTIAAVGNAMDNGADLYTNYCVSSIAEKDGAYVLSADNREPIVADYVVNATGVFADKIAGLVNDNSFTITPRRGEYILSDKKSGGIVSHSVFRVPSDMGKGILVTPTVDGNLLTGPTSEDITDKCDTATTSEGLERIKKEASENVRGINFGQSITSFCGLRAVGSSGDFIINSPAPRFVNAAGIESPGLTSSPAIAEYVVELLRKEGLTSQKNPNYNPDRKSNSFFAELSREGKNRIINENPAYGRIVCRCERITEGEIIDAIRRNPKPNDMDGIKRRTRAQMGRCQGGFCSPVVAELLACESGMALDGITKKGGESFILAGKTKEA